MTQALALAKRGPTRSAATLVWVLFSVSHVWLAAVNTSIRPGTFADVTGVYRFWFAQALGGNVMGIDEPWVYPMLAWLPIALAGIGGLSLYGLMWLLLITVLDGLAIWMLLRRHQGIMLACVYLGVQLLLGPIAVGRLDTITVPLVVMALIAVRDREIGTAGVLLTVAAWIKVWPGVIFLALLAIRGKQLWKRLLGAGLAVSVPVVLVSLLMGSGANVLSFFSQQGSRGLQVESVGATPYLWMSARGDAKVYFDQDILTYQVDGAGVEIVSALLTPLLAVAVAVILVFGWLANRRGVAPHTVLARMLFALVMALIVFNKVGSPQFVMWLIPVAIALAAVSWQRHYLELAMIAAVAFFTQLVYPWAYGAVLDASGFGLLLISGRNALEVILLVVAVISLARASVVKTPAAESAVSPEAAEAEAAAAPASQQPIR
ncbi:glycosyltransferase 87 family protein [Agrococcus casei]|uniref:glycosyltransferase 87 family protein n=1 Tax=Agrococcus casei TaxID=343512 RepID=UPI003F8F2054